MPDMSLTTEAKSDQLGADDLLGGPRTITLTSADINIGSDQPATLHYQGEEGKPFRPCKSMRRVIVKVWGKESSNYAGKSMTIYRDDKVKWGGLEVGGIRISHMSHMSDAVTMALTAKKGDKKPYTVKPLAQPPQRPQDAQFDLGALTTATDAFEASLPLYESVEGPNGFKGEWDRIKGDMQKHLNDRFKVLKAAVREHAIALAAKKSADDGEAI